jgi:hypothetical protein
MWLAVPAQFFWRLRHNTESATPLSDVALRALALDYSSLTLSNVIAMKIALPGDRKRRALGLAASVPQTHSLSSLRFTILHNLPN